MLLAWIRFGIAAAFILGGLSIIVLALVGVFRFDYILNRMHVAAPCDTLGILLMLIGFVVLNGAEPLSLTLKLILIIVFIWFANPVSGHLICKVEVVTNDKIDEELEVLHHDHI